MQAFFLDHSKNLSRSIEIKMSNDFRLYKKSSLFFQNLLKIYNNQIVKNQDKPGLQDEALQINYPYFMKEFDCSREQIRRYLVELENNNLIRREYRTIRTDTENHYNVLFVRILKLPKGALLIKREDHART
jgi:hypothetical protein